MTKKVLAAILGFMVCSAIPVAGQYSSRNKPVYKVIDYKVYQTKHFEIYHYLKNDSVLHLFALNAEKWYNRHQVIFKDSIHELNPILLYANHADFQQTNAIFGNIDVGTGGVTEGLKNRVTMPFSLSRAQTDHVFGHELVHAFQYNLLLNNDSSRQYRINNFPLWMIEGMAEYLSIGSVDANTSMWMRDALINKDFPTLDDMSAGYKYFPYRYGQAFWAFVGKTWGDSAIYSIFEQTARYGYDKALSNVLGLDAHTISALWLTAMDNHYGKYFRDSINLPVGKRLISSRNSGRINVSPSISPDGKYVVFLSEKEMLTLDLFLANAQTGKIIKKLSSTVRNSEIDAFNSYESSGTWSPDCKFFAFSVFSKGINKLAIVDVKKARIIKEVEIKGVPAFSNPSWSPDGKQMVVAGLVEGINSLYLLNLENDSVQKLTNDFYSYLQPSWSPDGSRIIFATDKPFGLNAYNPRNIQLASMDVASGQISVYNVFPGASNLNPLWGNDNKTIFFLSDADGFRNLYRYIPGDSTVERLTQFATGISGITEYSPAISLARDSDRIVYSYYLKNGYTLYGADLSEFKPETVKSNEVNFDAATLPPSNHVSIDIVDNSLKADTAYLPHKTNYKTVPYKADFKLDYLASSSVGVGISYFGTGMAGSIGAMFSDIVGNNVVYTELAVNGEVYDFGAKVAYLNRKHKISWGGSLSHYPYRYGYYSLLTDTVDGVAVDNYAIDIYRIFEDKASLIGMYALSSTKRIQMSLSSAYYYYRIERYYYGNSFVDANKEVLDAPSGFLMETVNAYYVDDNSVLSAVSYSPYTGHSFVVGAEKYIGKYDYVSATIDYRHYFYFKPFCLALGAMHQGHYGKNIESSYFSYPYFIGYPWYIRGYESIEEVDPNDVMLEQLMGHKLVVTKAELRVPLTGPEKMSLIKSQNWYTEFSIFIDAGLIWNDYDDIYFKWQLPSDAYNKYARLKATDPYNENIAVPRIPLTSIGASIRVNLFGAIVLEPYYAFPLQNKSSRSGTFGLNFLPGW